MIDRISDKIARFILNTDSYCDGKFESAIHVGSHIIVSTFFNVISILIIAGANGCIAEGVWFLVSFCMIRGYAGGYHAPNSKLCYAMSIGLFSFALICKELLISYMYVFQIVFWQYSPFGTAQNAIPEKIRNKRKRVVLVIFNLVFWFSVYRNTQLSYFGIMAILESEILLVLGKIKICCTEES